MEHSEDTIISSRKEDHVNLALTADVTVKSKSNGFEEFDIVPTAIPDINFDEIQLDVEFLGQKFSAPVLIAGMTGGYDNAEKINNSLAKVAEDLNIPFGVGSQRAMIKNPSMTKTYSVKDSNPNVYLIGNLGLVQFSYDFTIEDYFTAQDKIKADAMAIHVNPFQELCQPEGDLNWEGAWTNLKKICNESKVPVIVKEVGTGISGIEISRLEKIGCSAIDVGGAGGTSWPKLELYRNNLPNSLPMDDPTLNWGIPTAYATWEATAETSVPIISTGGMYHGLMAAKAITMGSHMVGIARPVLQALTTDGIDGAKKWLERYILDIKRVMFLMGIDNIEKLRQQKHRVIPHGKAREWLLRRNYL